jgi:hypothetical protein
MRAQLRSTVVAALTALTALAALLTACGSDSNPDAPPAYPERTAEQAAATPEGDDGTQGSAAPGATTTGGATPRDPAAAAAANRTRLERAPGRIFGAPLPAGLELVERTDDVARFRSSADLRLLSDFFRQELRSHRREPRTRGVEFTAMRSEEPDIFVLDLGEHREVVYFRAGLESEAATAVEELERTLTPQTANPDSLRARHPWPQGPVRRGVPTAGAAPGEPSGGSGLYDERIEIINGEEVRVLIPRHGAEPSTRGGRGGNAEPAVRYSYERPDGQRAMTRTPTTDRQGNPLRFGGSVEVEVPEGTIY